MNLVLFLGLLTILLVSIFWIIPTFAPKDKQDEIKEWLGLGFSGMLLVIALFETRMRDESLTIPVVFYLGVLALCLSGVYWWIPTYVKPKEQKTATTWLFYSVTIAIILTNLFSPAMRPTLGGRRR